MPFPLKNHLTSDVNGHRLTYLITLLNNEPIPESCKEHNERIESLVHRLYDLGADINPISELTSLSREAIFSIVPELARRAGDAQPTKQTTGFVESKAVSTEIGVPSPHAPTPEKSREMVYYSPRGYTTYEVTEPSTEPGASPKPSPVFPDHLVKYHPILEMVVHYKEGVEPMIRTKRDSYGTVIKHEVVLDHKEPAEPTTPKLKERIIDAVIKGHEAIYLTDDLKPGIKARAMDTFNGFQGTPREKAIQAVIHAHTELSTGT